MKYIYVVMIVVAILMSFAYYSGLFRKVAEKTIKKTSSRCNMPHMIEKDNMCVCDAESGYFPTFFDPYDINRESAMFESNINNTNCIKIFVAKL